MRKRFAMSRQEKTFTALGEARGLQHSLGRPPECHE